ncbi:transcriptional Coactivator p15-domain-containing protein [Aspergillus nidulans var. acristatus]
MASQSRKRVSEVVDHSIVDKPPLSKKSRTNAPDVAGFDNSRENVARKEDSNGDSYWEISKMRRVTISSFRGKTMVNIREYYEKDGEELPGKKGISLPIDQFSSLVTLLPAIEIALQEKGLSIPRPNYIDQGTNTGGNDKKDSTDGLPMARPSRENIEATSDEDENEE